MFLEPDAPQRTILIGVLNDWENPCETIDEFKGKAAIAAAILGGQAVQIQSESGAAQRGGSGAVSAALLLVPKARLGLEDEGGQWPRTQLVAQGFDKESLAPGAGLKVGDRIVALNGVDVLQEKRFADAWLRAAYSVFLAGRLLGPNGAVRLGIGALQRRLHSEFGRSGLAERVQSVLALGAALWIGLTLKLGLFQHPRLTRTSYRVPTQRSTGFDLWNEFQHRTSIPDLSIQVELHPAKQQVCLRLEGALSPTNAESLSQRIQDFMARTRSRLVLDLKRLNWDKVGDLAPLRERLMAYRSRIRLILPLSAAHPELILLAGTFHQYRA